VAVSAAVRAVQRARARREESLQEEDDGTGAPMHTLYAPPGGSPYNVTKQRELREKIQAALARLPESRRIVVGLHLKGLTTSEIAALLKWSEPKARNLVYRGLKDLRTSLRAVGIEEAS
jgi:RNA polymerase sigma factor (sigma-70 family)